MATISIARHFQWTSWLCFCLRLFVVWIHSEIVCPFLFYSSLDNYWHCTSKSGKAISVIILSWKDFLTKRGGERAFPSCDLGLIVSSLWTPRPNLFSTTPRECHRQYKLWNLKYVYSCACFSHSYFVQYHIRFFKTIAVTRMYWKEISILLVPQWKIFLLVKNHSCSKCNVVWSMVVVMSLCWKHPVLRTRLHGWSACCFTRPPRGYRQTALVSHWRWSWQSSTRSISSILSQTSPPRVNYSNR